MADDLLQTLETYKIQLQQVEAALTSEPDNEELKKLKVDLEEVLAITQELLQANSATGGAETSGTAASGEELKPVKEWKVGDKCMAVSSKNGQLYEAIIDGISEGKAAITFVAFNATEINKLTQLQLFHEVPQKKYIWDTKPKAGAPAGAGKTQWQVEKEKRRLKALKKAQRQKQLEEDKEKDKNKWKDFNKKAIQKSFKGVKKESIFASTESAGGRIGVGTCGTSGKPMTKFTFQDKHVPSSSTSKANYSMF